VIYAGAPEHERRAGLRILITGGTGFIGRRLVAKLEAAKHQLTVLVRDYARARLLLGSGPDLIRTVDELRHDSQFDVVINLAGAGIADQRWSSGRKKVLLDSRLQTTRQLVQLFQRLETRPRLLVNASAIGFYGAGDDSPLTEKSAGRDEFTHQLCKRWEEEAQKAEAADVKVCILRLGVVLGPGGGMLARLLPPFRFALGGRIGDGRQILSWIHIDDVIRGIEWSISEGKQGIFNLTAPEAVSNQQFTRVLAETLKRPAVLPMPAAVVRLLFGEMGDRLLLNGQNVIPARLLSEGFKFRYPKLAPALSACLCDLRPN
jgi:uncharacterized protein